MRPLFAVITLACWPTFFPGLAPGQPAPELRPNRVGKVIIIGNDITRDHVIHKVVYLSPGQPFLFPELRQAETNLRRLGIFRVDAEKGIRPTVTVIDRGDGSEFRDIEVRVEEGPTWGLRLRPGITPGGRLVVGLVVEERNFDPWGFPTCLDDILAGRAFRGGGQQLSLEVMRVPVLPCGLPGLAVLDRLIPPSAEWRVWSGGG